MIVHEFKIKAKPVQYKAIDEAILTAQFIRNKCLRYWMDNKGVSKYDLNKYCAVLAKEHSFANELNSMARQSSAERAWSSISRFYDNCKSGKPGKKGFPKFKKHSRSVEYKTSGWKLLDPKHIQFTDKKGIGKVKLVGTWELSFYSVDQIKRVRLVKRADGYYAQICINVDVRIDVEPSQNAIGLDLGLKYFIADSKGHTEYCPQFYRKAERHLNQANRRKSKKYRQGAKPQSHNYHKARNRYARKHLRVSRQRTEYCKRLAYSAIQSNDLVAYEDLNVKGLVRNWHLATWLKTVPRGTGELNASGDRPSSRVGYVLHCYGQSVNEESPYLQVGECQKRNCSKNNKDVGEAAVWQAQKKQLFPHPFCRQTLADSVKKFRRSIKQVRTGFTWT